MAIFTGTGNADTLTGGGENDVLQGLGGNDVLYGRDGSDLLEGGAGDDFLGDFGPFDSQSLVVTGADTLLGGDGNDTISADVFDAQVEGGAGDDRVGAGRPTGMSQAQVLTSVTGGDGDDVLVLGSFLPTDRIVFDGGAGQNSLELSSWFLPEVWLNQAHDGPGAIVLNVTRVDYLNTSTRMHGGEVAETYLADDWDDWIDAGGGADLVRGDRGQNFGGVVRGGKDTLLGGAGDDTLEGMANEDYLRGGDGNDVLSGGDAFDDLHGNLGEDTVRGGLGGDWVVGGQGSDRLFGEEGSDVILGNLGDDWAEGGAGDDVVRGGQGNDSISGGDGADYMAGDRGADTISGGAGADLFHTFSGAGLDRVLDFNSAEGDRVNVLAGTSYSLRQEGADTVIDMGGGDQMVLVGVSYATLPPGWIFTS
ncbi:calcium-binding protein [Phenylobacterium sp. VNQ135]|uniref:calcium-binding protein n=1 Tax=Phenylobacterium sp. VNQ135 TaxID=3400922 RepID=UPI003BFB2992